MQAAYERLARSHLSRHTSGYAAAQHRFDSMYERENLTWDLLVKCFNDLDTLVFQSDFRNRIVLKWVDIRTTDNEGAFAYTEPPANESTGRVSIRMGSNINRAALEPDYALGVLLHEMIHAYFFIWSRDAAIEQSWDPRADPWHGLTFLKAAGKVGRQFGLKIEGGSMGDALATHGYTSPYLDR